MSRVAVVGGGPAGLAAAVACRALGVDDVVGLEREAIAGGVPRHCDHTGFGLRDLRRVLRGPVYAARWVERAARAGVDVRTATSVLDGTTSLTTTSPRGVETIAADAVLLATGCRERPRHARLVPGTRPAGVLTTGALQQLVHLGHARVGHRAVVVGAEHVSFSAVLTLREAGCATVAMVTEHPAHQTYAPLAWIAGAPLLTRRRVVEIRGRSRVDGVVLDDGRTLACDTVVFTGDWIPDHELARRAGLAIDAGTRGPSVDPGGRTSTPGVFAAGNLVHAAETADLAALGGRAAATAIVDWLRTGTWPARVPVACERPLQWVWPQALDPGMPPSLPFRLRTATTARAALAATQDGRTLWRSRRRWLIPNRSIGVPAHAVTGVDPRGGPVSWRLV